MDLKVARIYLRVSTQQQSLERQEAIVESARAQGFHIAGIYREKASGAIAERPELARMILDLQPGEIVIAEHIDRISRLPLDKAELLIAQIKDKGARLSVPGILDLGEVTPSDGLPRILVEGLQDLLMKMALQTAREDYEYRRERQRQGIEKAKAAGRYQGRPGSQELHKKIIDCRTHGMSINVTADTLGCDRSTVKRIWAAHCKEGDQHRQIDAWGSKRANVIRKD